MEEGKIIRIEDPKLIPTILKLYDVRLDKQVLEPVQCTKAEWIQWLISILTKKDFAGIWALVIDNNIHRFPGRSHIWVSPAICRRSIFG